MTWSHGGKCCDLVRGREGGVIQGEGGRCCPGGREGGVVTLSWRGKGGREGDVVQGGGIMTWSQGGGVVTFGVAHLPPPRVEVTHTCENITFAHFATRAVFTGKYLRILLLFSAGH